MTDRLIDTIQTSTLVETDRVSEWAGKWRHTIPEEVFAELQDVLASRPWVRVEDAEDWEDDTQVAVRYINGEIDSPLDEDQWDMGDVRAYNNDSGLPDGDVSFLITHVWQPLYDDVPPPFGEEGG